MKESGGDRLKRAIYGSTLSTAARSPFPDGEGKEEAASPQVKKANPASLRSAAPSKGRGSRGHSLLPMEGGAPKGRRLDGESGISETKPSPRGEGAPKGRIGQERYEKERGRSSQVEDKREHPIHRWRGPPSPMGKAKRRRLRRK